VSWRTGFLALMPALPVSCWERPNEIAPDRKRSGER